jgi:ferredoxin/DNA-binding IclR family transcriptional regulator
MGSDIYRKLMEHLGNVGTGYPQYDEFIEVLKKNITPKEAEIALGLPTRLLPLEVEAIEVIARRLQKPVGEVEGILEGLAQKGFLYKDNTESGSMGYAFIQIGFGFPQIFNFKGEMSDAVKEITRPVVQYLKKGRDETPKHLYRYVPVNKAVDHTLQAVYTYDMMTEVVASASKIAVAHCPCRQRARLLTDSTCTHTLENCIKFNKMAEFVIDRGLGRELSREEALDIIRKSEEEGLIHFVDNCQEGIQHNCNCCSCCCWNVMPIKKGLVPRDYVMATYYLRTTDEETCIGCGQCATDCPLEIITMEDDKPVVDESICIGCGVCLLHCPTDAAKLKKKDDSVPYKDFATLHQDALKGAT